MRRMQAALEELRRGQELASSLLPFDGKLLKPNVGEVAEPAECSGLLNLPTLPLLAAVHVFC
jgi:hypothetical protein